MSEGNSLLHILNQTNPAAHDALEQSEFMEEEVRYWQYYIGLGILFFVAVFAGLLLTGFFLWTRYYRDLPELYNSWRQRANNPPTDEELQKELDEYVDVLARPKVLQATKLSVVESRQHQHPHDHGQHQNMSRSSSSPSNGTLTQSSAALSSSYESLRQYDHLMSLFDSREDVT